MHPLQPTNFNHHCTCQCFDAVHAGTDKNDLWINITGKQFFVQECNSIHYICFMFRLVHILKKYIQSDCKIDLVTANWYRFYPSYSLVDNTNKRS